MENIPLYYYHDGAGYAAEPLVAFLDIVFFFLN
jgi:hypothetical protein